MIDFEWNRLEQKQAGKMPREIGCGHFRIIPDAVRRRLKYDQEQEIRSQNCLPPYILFFATAYNEVRSCYKIYHRDIRIGDLSSHSFATIWNRQEIARVRDIHHISRLEGCRKCGE